MNSSQQSATGRPMAAKLFVGQVPAVCTEDMLRPLFVPYGEISEIKIMRDVVTGRSKGCAWVRYTAYEMGEAAINALHGKHCIPPQTNPLQVRFAEARSARPGPPMNRSNESNTLFVGNLPPETTSEDFAQFLYRMIGDASIKDASVPRGKLFGFATFATATEAEAAHQRLTGAEFGNQAVRVELARPRMQRMPMTHQMGGQVPFNMPMAGHMHAMPHIQQQPYQPAFVPGY